MMKTLMFLVMSVGLFAQNNFKQAMVSFDLDDGWHTTYDNAIPILDKAHFKATDFIIVGNMNAPYISFKEAKDLQNKGYEIGSHTLHHLDLSTLESDEIVSEIVGSGSLMFRNKLKPNTFAYPYGNYNTESIALLDNLNYLSGRTDKPGFNDKNTDPFKLYGQSVELTTTLDQVKDWVDTAITTKTWLILIFHQVDNSNTEFSTTPENFQQIVNYVKQNGIKVVTNEQGSRYVRSQR